MEYIDGPNLQQVLTRKGALNIGLASEYVRQAALGLQHAHETGMVHRDVKPANILVDSGGTVKVLDLGLARVERDDGQSVTRRYNSSAVLGTADYLAPEQALSLHDVDGRADIYGLGATFYTLLAGRPPFPGGTIGQKLMWHQTRNPEPISSVRPEVPPDLAALVTRMLAKKPDDRLATMNDVAQALQAWASPPPRSEVRPPSSPSLHDIPSTGPGSGSPVGSATARLLPPESKPETLAEIGELDTATSDQASDSPLDLPVRDLVLGEDPGKKFLLLGSLSAGVVALVFGVIAFLIWGPRP
jgi:serine/threonine protein kinase